MQVVKSNMYALAILMAVTMIMLPAGCSQTKLAQENMMTKSQLADLQKRVDQIEADRAKAQEQAANLQRELAQVADREKLTLQKLDQYTVLSLPNTLVFASGSIKLSEDGTRVLGKIAEILKRYPSYEIRVEGHTDNKRIKPEFQSKYATNWELSSARATAVVRSLVNGHKMNPIRLGAVGYGEFRPVASNDSEEGRAKNRRVEVHIYPSMESKILTQG